MKVSCTNKETFQLTDNEQLVGQLSYKHLFSQNAVISLADSNEYQINPVGFFNTSISVTKNSTEIASLKINWKSQVVISFQDGQEFILKPFGTFNVRYIVENKNGEKLFQLNPDFDWKKFNYKYEISYDKKPEDILLVLLSVYAVNYIIASFMGTTIATMAI